MAMNQDARVKVDFATYFDGRALAQGTKQIDTFQKLINKTGKQLAGLYSISRIIRYSKTAVSSAFQESKAQAQLANQLKNVGLGYATITSEKWIQDFQTQTGIIDDELRPAFAQLARVTKDLSQTQELMSLAFDVAGGAGIDYASAVDILSQAYVGNYRGLKQLNLGISQAKLQTMTAGEVFTLMGDRFKGAGDSMITAGDRLNVMFSDLKDNVGAAIIKGLADESNIQSMNDMTKALKDMMPVVTFIASAFKELAKFASTTIQLFDKNSDIWRKVEGKAPKPSMIPKGYYESLKQGTKATNDSIKALTTTAKILKANTAQQAKTVALQKLSNLLRAAQRVFDNEAITLAAAAQGKLTEEERARLKLKQDIYDLEQAIAAGNVEQATKIGQTLLQDAELLKQLRGGMLSLNGLPDPFEVWLNTLREILATLAKLPTIPTNPFNLGINAAGFATQNGVQIVPTLGPDRVSSIYNYPVGVNPYRLAAMADGGIVTQATPAIVGEAGAEAIIPLDRLGQMSSPVINIQINPAVAGLIDVIQQQSASGISPIVNRVSSPYIA